MNTISKKLAVKNVVLSDASHAVIADFAKQSAEVIYLGLMELKPADVSVLDWLQQEKADLNDRKEKQAWSDAWEEWQEFYNPAKLFQSNEVVTKEIAGILGMKLSDFPMSLLDLEFQDDNHQEIMDVVSFIDDSVIEEVVKIFDLKANIIIA